MAGVAGNGQDELVQALIGLRHALGGKVTLLTAGRHGVLAAPASTRRAWDTFPATAIALG